jgi:hypothetical protein
LVGLNKIIALVGKKDFKKYWYSSWVHAQKQEASQKSAGKSSSGAVDSTSGGSAGGQASHQPFSLLGKIHRATIDTVH